MVGPLDNTRLGGFFFPNNSPRNIRAVVVVDLQLPVQSVPIITEVVSSNCNMW